MTYRKQFAREPFLEFVIRSRVRAPFSLFSRHTSTVVGYDPEGFPLFFEPFPRWFPGFAAPPIGRGSRPITQWYRHRTPSSVEVTRHGAYFGASPRVADSTSCRSSLYTRETVSRDTPPPGGVWRARNGVQRCTRTYETTTTNAKSFDAANGAANNVD